MWRSFSTFTYVCIDCFQIILEHHRSLSPFMSVLIAAELIELEHIQTRIIVAKLLLKEM